MSALQKPRLTREREGSGRRGPAGPNVVCWGGAMVALSGAGAAAVIVPVTADPALRVLGVSQDTVDNRLSAAGAKQVDYRRGVWQFDNDPADPVTPGEIGQPCFAGDDQTISKTSAGGKPEAGIVFDVDATGVWVKFA